MNQHYVPRAYLKNFSEQRGKEYFIEVYDRLNDRWFTTNIKRVCSEIDLYTLEEGNAFAKDIFAIEKIYANGFEPLYLNAYRLLTNHTIFHINDLQRAEILLSVFQFYVRNPKLLRRSLAFHKSEIALRCEEAKNKGVKGVTYLGEDFSFREYTEETIFSFFETKITKEYKEKHIGGIGELGDFHQTAVFEIMVIRDEAEFFTSDHPLVFEDHVTEDEHPASRSKEFILPLNKKVALRLYHDNQKRLDQIYRCWIPNGSVATINQLIMEQSSRFVMTSQSAMKEHKRIHVTFLESTSIELKIDAMRQILEKFTETADNKEGMAIIRHYLNLYESQGHLTEEQHYQLHVEMNKAKVSFVKRRIQ